MYVTYQTVLNYFFNAMVLCNEEKVGKDLAESVFGVTKL